MRFGLLTCLFSLSLLTVIARSADSQDPDSATMTMFGDLVELGREFEIELNDGGLLEFNPTPLLNWNNPTRGTGQKGCVFVWHRNGRPQVIGSVFAYGDEKQTNLRHELHSLAEQPLTARYGDRIAWKPTQPGIKWLDVKDIAEPRKTERLRLAQMRGIARQYTGTLQRPNGNKMTLELKSTPLYRYSSEKANIQDGAIFSLAQGTDPEILLIVEATTKESKPVWRVAFARFHYWKAVVENSLGETVWQAKMAMELLPTRMGNPVSVKPIYTSYLVERRRVEPESPTPPEGE